MSERAQRNAMAGIAAIITIALMALLATRTGDAPDAGLNLIFAITQALPPAIGWIGAAAGFGIWLARLLRVRSVRFSVSIHGALGAGALLFMDALLGRLGWLTIGSGISTWTLTIIGLALLATSIIAARRRARPSLASGSAMFLLICAPAMATLLVAASSAPGWLWATEFGGYDALSYHLQLPREWLDLGRITLLEHNVYSAMPGYTEAAYLHLMALRGDPIQSVYACQWLHAGFCIAAAIALIEAATAWGCRPAWSWAAGPICLGIPWMIVVGSLAYNDVAVVFFLAAAMSWSARLDAASCRDTVVLSALTAVACGCKLTAIGYVAMPLAIMWCLRPALPDATTSLSSWPRRIAAALCGAVVFILVLSPWLIGNLLATGNPVFPFLTGLFGLGHWTAEQATIWHQAHFAGDSITARVSEAWHQFPLFGLGSTPYAAVEPWLAQWSIFPWLILIATGIGFARRNLRRHTIVLAAIMITQLAFWLLFTHIKSRFMLPIIAPGALLLILVIDELCRGRASDRWLRWSMATVLLAWCAQPLVLFWHERDGAPAARTGMADIISGDALTPELRRHLSNDSAILMLNYMLPDDACVLFVGEAAPLYFRGRFDYTTTWDHSPMIAAVESDSLEPLTDAGYTHLLINAPMLKRWADDRWGHGQMHPGRVVSLADRDADLERSFLSGLRLYELSD